LLAAEEHTLDTLTSEFDALLARMQQPGMAEAMERAFAMSPAQLGAAAVGQARSSRPPGEHKRGKRKLPRAK
jgi:hypothetical protein